MKTNKDDYVVAMGITLSEGEEVTADTVEELTNGKGDEDNE